MWYSTDGGGINKIWGPRWLFEYKNNRISPKIRTKKGVATGIGLCQEDGGDLEPKLSFPP